MIKKPICYRCKTYKNLSIHGRVMRKKNGERIIYMCKTCNTERQKRYRQTEKGNANVKKAVYKSMKKYPEKTKARQIIAWEIKSGKIKRPKSCPKCRVPKLVEAHCTNISDPLNNISWSCRQCFKKNK